MDRGVSESSRTLRYPGTYLWVAPHCHSDLTTREKVNQLKKMVMAREEHEKNIVVITVPLPTAEGGGRKRHGRSDDASKERSMKSFSHRWQYWPVRGRASH